MLGTGCCNRGAQLTGRFSVSQLLLIDDPQEDDQAGDATHHKKSCKSQLGTLVQVELPNGQYGDHQDKKVSEQIGNGNGSEQRKHVQAFSIGRFLPILLDGRASNQRGNDSAKKPRNTDDYHSADSNFEISSRP